MPKISEYDECGHENFHEFGRCLYKYTDCGPWVVAVLMDGQEIYYDNKEAWELPMDTEVRYLKVGSIVEGSDVEVGPYEVEDPKEFWKTVKDINDECDFFWRRDNLDHFRLLRKDKCIGYLECGWGECTLELMGHRVLKKDRAALDKFCRNGEYCIPDKEIQGALHTPDYGEILEVPGTKLKLEFYLDDSCY